MLLYSYLTLWKVRKNVCLCLFSVINNWLLRTNLLCIMNALSAFCGRIVKSSVWTPNATLPRWSAKTIWSLFHFRNPLLPSINHPLSVAYLQFLLSYTQTVLKSWNPACISRIILPFFFFLIWFFAALTLSVHSSVSEIYFWLLGQANMLIIFLSPHNCSHNLHPYHFTMGNTLFQIKSFVPCLFLPSSFFNALYSIAPCSLPLLCFVFTFF